MVLKLLLALIFIGYLIFKAHPELTDQQREALLNAAPIFQNLSLTLEVMKDYSSNNPFYILITFSYLFIFMRTFYLPGVPILMVASPTLFGVYFSLALIPFLEAIGVSGAYLLSREMIAGFVVNWKSEMVYKFCKRVREQKNNIVYYVMFMRISPIFLKPLVNVCSPIAQIPMKYFFLGSLVGCIPMVWIHVEMGNEVKNLQDFGITWTTFISLILLSFLVLVPT